MKPKERNIEANETIRDGTEKKLWEQSNEEREEYTKGV
jgi:hypothetical protein